METRVFSRTEIQLSMLGFGCGAVGGLMVRGDPLDQERSLVPATAALEGCDRLKHSLSEHRRPELYECRRTGGGTAFGVNTIKAYGDTAVAEHAIAPMPKCRARIPCVEILPSWTLPNESHHKSLLASGNAAP